MATISPRSASSFASELKNREKFQADGTPSRRGTGFKIPLGPPGPPPTSRFGRRRGSSGSNPHTSNSAGLRPSSRNNDCIETCWKTIPATSARHIARIG